MVPARMPLVVLALAAGAASVLAGRGFIIFAELVREQAPSTDLLRAGSLACTAFAAAVGLLATLRAPAARRSTVALALLATIMIAYVAELVAPPGFRLVARYARERLNHVRSIRATREPAYPAPFPIETLLSSARGPLVPLAGVSQALTVLCREADGWLTFRADEHGFHNPPGLWQPDGVAAVALGDSFTAGNCVPSGDNFVARLRRLQPRTLNLGYHGLGPLGMLGILREYLHALHPPLVLWCFFANDLLDLRVEALHPILRRYVEPDFSQELMGRQHELDALLARFLDERLAASVRDAVPSRMADFLLLRNLRAGVGLSVATLATPGAEEYTLLEEVLKQAHSEVRSWGGRLIFVYLPHRLEVSASRELGAGLARRRAEFQRQRVVAVAAGLGLPFVDLSDAFRSAPDPAALYACDHCHFSREGHGRAAHVLRGVLAPAGTP